MYFLACLLDSGIFSLLPMWLCTSREKGTCVLVSAQLFPILYFHFCFYFCNFFYHLSQPFQKIYSFLICFLCHIIRLFLVLFCLVMFCFLHFNWFRLLCFGMFCSVLSYPVLFCPILFCPILSCSVLFCHILSYPVLSYPVLFCSVVLFGSTLRFHDPDTTLLSYSSHPSVFFFSNPISSLSFFFNHFT